MRTAKARADKDGDAKHRCERDRVVGPQLTFDRRCLALQRKYPRLGVTMISRCFHFFASLSSSTPSSCCRRRMESKNHREPPLPAWMKHLAPVEMLSEVEVLLGSGSRGNATTTVRWWLSKQSCRHLAPSPPCTPPGWWLCYCSKKRVLVCVHFSVVGVLFSQISWEKPPPPP